MTAAQAEALAERTLAAIDYREQYGSAVSAELAADRERVASDLAGLLDAYAHDSTHNGHATRYLDGLRRTAALYGVSA